MDITWIIVIAVLGLAAVAGTVFMLFTERAPREPADPERVARLRDRVADGVARRLPQADEPPAGEQRHARRHAPQRTPAVSTERIWAGGL